MPTAASKQVVGVTFWNSCYIGFGNWHQVNGIPIYTYVHIFIQVLLYILWRTGLYCYYIPTNIILNLPDLQSVLIMPFRAISSRIGGFPRPQLNLSSQIFATIFDQAVGFPLVPQFDPYANTLNYLLASYMIPYVGLVGYVGTIPSLVTYNARSVSTSLSFKLSWYIILTYRVRFLFFSPVFNNSWSIT